MKGQLRLILIIAILLLGLANVVSAQEDVVYVFNGTELQRIENGVVVQSWYMPNGLETQQIRAALEARERYGDVANQYAFSFDADRMYILHGGQVDGLWLLRGNRWVEQPLLNVQYLYGGGEIRRVVNGEVQQAWVMPNSSETQALMVALQAGANKVVARHMFTELYVDFEIQHVPQLVDQNFTFHYVPLDKTADWSWYKPELGAILAEAIAEPAADPIVLAEGDLVVTQHPADTDFATMLLSIPELEAADDAALYDIYRIEDGQIVDLWMGYDLTALAPK